MKSNAFLLYQQNKGCNVGPMLAFQKVFSPVQSFCRNDIFLTFPRTGFSHFISPKPPQKPGEIDWYPRKCGSRSGGTFYIPEWMNPKTSHNNKGKLCYDIPGEKPHYIYQYMACLGESWVNHEFALFFLRVDVIFTKIPGFQIFSPCNNIAHIAHFWKASIQLTY